ncbi:CPXCG motif-containing cysteine-rich protein [Bizionia argentinensis JUB59]|uniref:CPXCG motif-containing cysteine-rich protein n=1 Tax=Bizionia argentinensis JUB59 TaxID=1046627 RepID=A0A4U8UHR9_9FLAO|nr:CPXCG motif-containing cysteine-rich protein [Bizionia argentinensis]TLG99024.1 CPXCG motif-containing cysteine-rich protein [Bizionia argentinensis JUB59]
MNEHEFQCPYCWETISMLLDSSQPEQEYVEDCEICCNPIQISVKFEGQTLVMFNAINLEQ